MAKRAARPRGAEPIAAQSSSAPLEEVLAPRPMTDRYPIVLGQNISLTSLANAFRLCTSGFRYQLVDILNELIEHDPHARGVVRQRTQAVAGGRVELSPAELPDGDPDTALAAEICQEVATSVHAIPRLSQALHALAWGIFYGITGAETMWNYDPSSQGLAWRPTALANLHSRRINFPQLDSWDPYIWDQGAGVGIFDPHQPGKRIGVPGSGLRCADFPGKFIIHAPQLNGDYPLRDGEGRYIATYMLLKRMVVRSSAQDFERTIRPWVLGYFKREGKGPKSDQVATTKDIQQLDAVVQALGLGSLSNGVLPESVKVEILRAASEYKIGDFLRFLDASISKGILGQTFTTEGGVTGSRASAQVGKEGAKELSRYDAACLADTLERDLIYWIVRLNYGIEAATRLCPRARIAVEEPLAPKDLMELAVKGASIDMPIDADKLAKRTGLELVPPPPPEKGQEPEPRRTRIVSPAPPVNETPDGKLEPKPTTGTPVLGEPAEGADDAPDTAPADDADADT